MYKSLRSFGCMALLSCVAVAASATSASSFIGFVDGHDNSTRLDGDLLGTGLNTGITIAPGTEKFTITASGTWDTSTNYNPGDWLVNGNGGAYGATIGGLYANFGSLVGQIGNGDYFFIGDGTHTFTTNETGALKLFVFDSDNSNNTGAIEVSVSAVPEPANMALMLGGLGLLGFAARRKQASI